MTAIAEEAPPIEDAPPTPAPKVSFRIRRDDFVLALTEGALCAGSDWTLPMLTGVHVVIDPKGLITAESTDRFTLCRRTFHLDVNDTENAFAFDGAAAVGLVLPKSDLTRIAQMHTASPRGQAPRTLNVTVAGRTEDSIGSITIESGGGYDAHVLSTHKGIDVEYINAQGILDSAVPTAQAGAMVNPEYLPRFAKVKHSRTRGAQIKFCGPGKPVRIEIGDQFVGLIMPMREDA
jgi:DNA polymerase III sliding clamp (beta) subunit (PCNA family)